jgi:hypothetical protein
VLLSAYGATQAWEQGVRHRLEGGYVEHVGLETPEQPGKPGQVPHCQRALLAAGQVGLEVLPLSG